MAENTAKKFVKVKGIHNILEYDTENNIYNASGILDTVSTIATPNSFCIIECDEEDNNVGYRGYYILAQNLLIPFGGDLMIPVTYDELKELRDKSILVPGMQYRITDYECTTSTENTQSAGHQFDIIVTADSENTLNENARAIQHEGDTYFENCNLEAWELKYSMDNDTDRFEWADETNGKGVIFYMKDEWNNECPYDFKNIQYNLSISFIYTQWGSNYKFVRDSSIDKTEEGIKYYGYKSSKIPSAWEDSICYTTESTPILSMDLYSSSLSPLSYGGEVICVFTTERNNVYTFLNSEDNSDNSIIGVSDNIRCEKNVIKSYINNKQILNAILFIGQYMYGNTFGNDCFENRFGDNSYYNVFGNDCYYNVFGFNCYSNKFDRKCFVNIFDNICFENTFECGCNSNTFDEYCTNNKFGNGCYLNRLNTNCHYNIFESNCFQNTVKYGCIGNHLSVGCHNNKLNIQCMSNNFGNQCNDNILGNECSYNTFGQYCNNIKFGSSGATASTDDDVIKSYYQYITIESGNKFIYLNCTSTTSSSRPYRNVIIESGVNNENSYKQIDDSNVNQTYKTTIEPKNSKTIVA